MSVLDFIFSFPPNRRRARNERAHQRASRRAYQHSSASDLGFGRLIGRARRVTGPYVVWGQRDGLVVAPRRQVACGRKHRLKGDRHADGHQGTSLGAIVGRFLIRAAGHAAVHFGRGLLLLEDASCCHGTHERPHSQADDGNDSEQPTYGYWYSHTHILTRPEDVGNALRIASAAVTSRPGAS